MGTLTRRTFHLAGAAGLTALAAGRAAGAAERIRLGFIGLGNRGDQVLDGFLQHKDCQVTGLCDIHDPYLDFAAKKIGGTPKRYKDYRDLLASKEVDAVVISTPDHWHALQMIHACQAEKDVYVEKPLSLTVVEGRRMADAARKHRRVVQVGIMRRSAPYLKEAAELVRGGAIGKVTFARAFHIQNEWPKGIDSPKDGDAPEGLDWEAWLGPAPLRKYNANRTFYRFRWFYDHSGGQLTNFGVHYLDMIQWALGQDRPLSVAAMGGKFAVEDNREVPDTMEVMWQYPGGTLVTFTQINANAGPWGLRNAEIEFRGTKGTMLILRNGYEIIPDNITPNPFPARTPVDRTVEKGWRTGAKQHIKPAKKEDKDATPLHARNFLDCVRSRKACNCDVETGHRATTAAVIGNIAHKTRALLEWDGKAERFTNSEAANRLLSYEYRKPYKLPG